VRQLSNSPRGAALQDSRPRPALRFHGRVDGPAWLARSFRNRCWTALGSLCLPRAWRSNSAKNSRVQFWGLAAGPGRQGDRFIGLKELLKRNLSECSTRCSLSTEHRRPSGENPRPPGLPDFQIPPVTEVVLSVQFEPPMHLFAALTPACTGTRFETEYPRGIGAGRRLLLLFRDLVGRRTMRDSGDSRCLPVSRCFRRRWRVHWFETHEW